jgi:propionyl-CoA carboxylase beta chain
VAHFSCLDEDDCLERARELLSFLPNGNYVKPTKEFTNDPVTRENNKLKDFVPVNSKKPYDMKELIMEVVDE